MKNLFGFKQEKKYLSAEEARNITRFGYENVTLEKAISVEIETIEESIKSKSRAGYGALAKVYHDYSQDLLEKLLKHFKDKGFTAYLYKNPEIERFIILIIGWN